MSAMKQTKKPFDLCPFCSGEIVEKEVEKLLRGVGDFGIYL